MEPLAAHDHPAIRDRLRLGRAEAQSAMGPGPVARQARPFPLAPTHLRWTRSRATASAEGGGHAIIQVYDQPTPKSASRLTGKRLRAHVPDRRRRKGPTALESGHPAVELIAGAAVNSVAHGMTRLLAQVRNTKQLSDLLRGTLVVGRKRPSLGLWR